MIKIKSVIVLIKKFKIVYVEKIYVNNIQYLKMAVIVDCAIKLNLLWQYVVLLYKYEIYLINFKIIPE